MKRSEVVVGGASRHRGHLRRTGGCAAAIGLALVAAAVSARAVTAARKVEPRPKPLPDLRVSCVDVPADAAFHLGRGTQSSTAATANSGAAYASPHRVCPRFVVDVTVPADHRSYAGSKLYVHATVDPSKVAHQPRCEGSYVELGLYQRSKEGSWVQLPLASMRGVWRKPVRDGSIQLGSGCSIDLATPTEGIPLLAGKALDLRVLALATIGGHPVQVEVRAVQLDPVS